jgi:hypothetical protein
MTFLMERAQRCGRPRILSSCTLLWERKYRLHVTLCLHFNFWTGWLIFAFGTAVLPVEPVPSFTVIT